MLGKIPLLLGFLAFCAYGAHEVWQRMNQCVAEVRADLTSPNGLRRAVLYGMDCRATNGFDMHLALLPPDEDFRAERHPPVLVVDGDHPISLKWQNDRTLVVGLPAHDHVIEQQEDRAGAVHILYQRADASAVTP